MLDILCYMKNCMGISILTQIRIKGLICTPAYRQKQPEQIGKNQKNCYERRNRIPLQERSSRGGREEDF